MSSDTMEENNKLPSITDIFEEYKDYEIEIVFIGNYNIFERPYYCKVIFHVNTTEKDNYPIAYMVPEQLSEQYIVGTKFKNGKCIGLGNGVKDTYYEFDPNYFYDANKIRDVIPLNDYNLRRLIHNNAKEEEFYLNQHCYVLEYENTNFIAIIPQYVIANYFYLISTRLKEAALEGGLSQLCYINTFKQLSRRRYKIRLKRSFQQVERENICNILKSDYSRKQYKSFVSYRALMSNSKSKYVPIRADMPFNENGGISALMKIILQTKEKLIHVVLHIYDDRFFKPSSIQAEIDNYTTDSDSDEGSGTPPGGRKPKNNGKTNNNKPSSQNSKGKRKSFSLSRYRKKIYSQHEDIAIETAGYKPIFRREETPMEVEGSFEDPTADGNENTQQMEQVPSSDEPPKSSKKAKAPNGKIFELSGFIELFNSLKEQKDISNTRLSKQVEMIPTEDTKGKIPSRYYMPKNNIRKFFYGYFTYKNKHFAFLEIEHGGSWVNISTWFFMFENKAFNTDFFHEFIYQYLCVHKNLETVEKNFFKSDKIKFFSQRHPTEINTTSSKNKDKTIAELEKEKNNSWAKFVIEKISSLNNSYTDK